MERSVLLTVALPIEVTYLSQSREHCLRAIRFRVVRTKLATLTYAPDRLDTGAIANFPTFDIGPNLDYITRALVSW